MKKLFVGFMVAVMLMIANVSEAALIKLTKIYRCVANPELITYMNPYEIQSGTTRFSDLFYPFYFETNVVEEMTAYIDANGIVIYQE